MFMAFNLLEDLTTWYLSPPYPGLQLDGTPALNLASFVTTYMDESAEKLMLETLNKNAIDAVSIYR